MLNKLFTSKEILRHDMGYCRLYETKYNGVRCTKMYFTVDSPSKYEFLRTTTHYNILPVYKITQHSIFTKLVVPFSAVFDKHRVKYNEYVIAKLRETLNFIHDELQLEHCNIVMSALFVDVHGNILIGKFDRCTEFRSAEDDEYLLNELCLSILEKDLSEVGDGDILFRTLEKKENFEKFTIDQKREFVYHMIENKDEFMECVMRNIIGLLLEDISKSNSEEYKIFILDSLIKLDNDLLITFSKDLFSILDSSIRLYLLKNLSGLGGLNECVGEICLGLRVKDRALRLETINFIFRNSSKFSTKAFSWILETMQEDVTDAESIAVVCYALLDMERVDVYRPVYKFLLRFLILDKEKMLLYQCTERFFPHFDKYKISTELLPLLCSKLSVVEAQDTCFHLVEKILSFLKEYKSEIRSKEWSFRNLKGIFVTKKVQDEAAISERIMRLSKEDKEDEWEEKDVV